MSVIHSLLMMGQSNMAGRGYPADVEKISDDRLLMLRNGRWQRMTEPVNYDRPFSGVSLAASFAVEYAKDHPDVSVGLIPCADGGSSLDDWAVGGLLYDHAVFQARLVQRTSQITAILWHQGEGDCHVSRAPLYEDKFMTIMNAMRRELGLREVPMMIGALGDFLADCTLSENMKNYRAVNEQLMGICRKYPNYYYIAADGLTANGDLLHFNASSLREFGRRYYRGFISRRSVTSDMIAYDPVITPPK